jgi:CHAT domain-containing protein/uncharacterized protein HemY
MARKKSRFRRIKRLFSLLLLLAMFLGAGLLPPTFAYMTAENSTVQSLPDAQNLFEQGRKFYEAERFAEAATIWQQAVSAFKANGDELSLAMTLGNLSLAYQQLGQWTEAESAITDSLNLLGYSEQRGTGERENSLIPNPKSKIPNLQILAQALDIQGRLQLALAKAEDALKTWRKALDIYTKVGNIDAIIRNRINQAQALQALGLYRQAEKTLTELNQLLQNQPDTPLKVTGLRSLGNVLRVTGDLELSRKVLEQSLAVASSLPDTQAIGDVLLSLGNTASAQADTQAAIEYYRQAANAATSPTTRINAQINQLRLLLETEQFTAFQALSSQIKTKIGNLPPSRTAIYAKVNFAESLTRLRKNTTTNTPTNTPSWLDIAQLLSTALQQAKSLQDRHTESYALGTLGGLYEQTQQWSDAQDLTQHALLMAQTIDAKDIAYRWQWQLGRLLRARGDIKGAIAAYTEAFNSLKSLRRDLVAINPEAQFSFRENVEPVYRELVDLLLTTVGDSPSRRVGNSEPTPENLKQARNVIESLQLAELENFFREACLVAKVGLDEVIDKEAPTTAVIYPIILPNRLEVILKLANQNLRRYTTAVPQSEVESIIEQLREDIKERKIGGDNQSRFQKMYELLLRQAETDLRNSNVETLVFVLDGSLRNIPMSALYDGKQYLVEKYSVAVSPGLQLFDLKPLAPGQLEALTGGLSEARHNFPKLDYVESELKQIQSQVSSKMLLNPEFTSKAFQTQINSHSFPVVHLATHGQFSSNPDKTFILAYDQPIKVNELNKLLRSRDEKRPDAIELLVLSACQTAAGDKRAALGLAGVAVRAGARSTLASLWNLNDASTALLMSHFYQELAKPGVSKAEALRRAQLALLKQEEYEIPYFWAPYVLIGNWL